MKKLFYIIIAIAVVGAGYYVNEVYIYPGVGHAFANPSGMNYAPEETKDAWVKTTAFLKKHLTASVN